MRKRLTLTAVVAALVACSAALVAAPHETRAAFPGQNGRIAFSADVSPRAAPHVPEDVWAMDPDGTDLVNLTREQPCCNDDPDWSPDGTKVAFESTRDGQSEIYVMDADGTNQTNLTDTPDTNEGQPAWSPDGTRIAFTSAEVGGIWVMNADGSDPVRITSAGHSPAWSPDGKRMAFVGGAQNPYEWCGGLGHSEIFVASADGSGTPERITRVAEGDPDCAGFFAAYPDWSPDGTKIAYSSGASYFGSAIYIIGPDGSGERLVAHIPSGDTPSSTPAGEPSWSPDGSQIALWGYGPSGREIFAVNADGSGAPRSLTNPQGCDGCQEFWVGSPDWGTAPPIAAPDTQAPKVISTFPRGGGEVGPTANIRASFSEEMQVASVKNAFKLFKKGSTTQIAAQVSYDASTDKATLNPTNNLRRAATYKAVVSTVAKDVEGNRLDQNRSTAGLQQKVWFFEID